MTLQEQASSENVLKAEESALIELSNKIVQAAIVEGASDIHIDPALEETKVRFRSDGVMQDILTLPKNVHGPLMTRFKIMADVDASIQNNIQYGRIPIRYEEHDFDLRLTALPTIDGEKATFRILAAEAPVRLDRLGYRDADRERLEKSLRSPNGLMVFAGPAGCGKTTCMYAAMQELIGPDRTLMTVEDPVEIRFPGVTQISVNRKAGILFPDALLGIFRADPDIVMVGEMPDRETTELCLKIAITGHLMMTTLHAPDAPSAIPRLIDIGLEPFMLAAGLLMVSAQRLVRRVCTECKEEVSYPDEIMTEWRKGAEAGGLIWPDPPPAFYKGKGCDRCRGTGYRGRMAIYEVLGMDAELCDMVSANASLSDIREAAVRKGMTTMLADGMIKAMSGQTTVEEVVRVLGM